MLMWYRRWEAARKWYMDHPSTTVVPLGVLGLAIRNQAMTLADLSSLQKMVCSDFAYVVCIMYLCELECFAFVLAMVGLAFGVIVPPFCLLRLRCSCPPLALPPSKRVPCLTA